MVYRVGVDIGGTFTDAVCVDEAGRVRTAKAPSTPGRLADGVLQAVELLEVPLDEVDSFIHGTTAGLNAFLERRGARVALLTTEGFRDVYEIGRANRPDMYNLQYRPPEPLVPRHAIFEVAERLDANGSVVREPQLEALRDVVRNLAGAYDAVAVCLLHAYANPRHEKLVEGFIQDVSPGMTVVCSHDVAPEWREYERTSTTVISAYVAPIVAGYLSALEDRLAARGLRAPLQVMQSNGGLMTAAVAKSKPVATLLSGPVGGTIAGVTLAAQLDGDESQRLICVDMGGTSFDVSLVIDGEADVQAQSALEGHPVLAPSVAIHTVGAGGGSIGHVRGGGLRVGPRSAGAVPGPACYGNGGTEPTVTDANFLLGRIPTSSQLGGSLALDRSAAEQATATVADALGMTITQLAQGIVAVADTAMANAIREITVQRGIDPRDFSLVAFGGAGPLHAVSLAEELELRQVVVPRDPGVLSAWGMLQSDTRHDTVLSFYARLSDVEPESFAQAVADLSERAQLMLKEDGVHAEAVALEAAADLRYAGQEYTVTVPFSVGADTATTLHTLPDDFSRAHKERYGHNNPDEAVEIVNLRMTALGRVPRPPRQMLPAGDPPEALAVDSAVFDGMPHDTSVYRRDELTAGSVVDGPSVLIEDACTVLIPPGWQARCTPHGHLLLRRITP